MATLFTPNNKEVEEDPGIKINGAPIRLEPNPKILGVTFDPMATFSPHIAETVKKAKSKLNILKSLASSSWGQDKETILITYKSICRSVLEYSNPIWSPSICQTNWDKLQVIQNKALRIANGCLTLSGIDHLHQETKVLPIKEHATMLTKQFTASFTNPTHPGFKHFLLAPPPRNIKKSLTNHKQCIISYQDRGLSVKETIKRIHTDTVQDIIPKLEENRVLKDKPPDIDPSELTLPRKCRTELARLRSGFSRNLKSYMSRIDPEVVDKCPECDTSPHDVEHVFNCPMNPTELDPSDLWLRPTEVAAFLKLDDDIPGD